MSGYKTLMLGLDPSGSFENRIKLASDLADRFSARLIAVAGRFPVVSVVGEAPFASIAVMADDDRFAHEDASNLETRYRSVANVRAHDEVRIVVEAPTPFLLRQARAADLVILARRGDDDDFDARYSVNPADVVLESGRSVLIVPPPISYLRGKRILIAWSDTKECRRAIRDAIPFLVAAEYVTIASVNQHADASDVSDIMSFLQAHGIETSVRSEATADRGIGERLLAMSEDEDADLIVAGAYGHSRFREWVLGGVTQDLMKRTPVCCFLAH